MRDTLNIRGLAKSCIISRDFQKVLSSKIVHSSICFSPSLDFKMPELAFIHRNVDVYLEIIHKKSIWKSFTQSFEARLKRAHPKTELLAEHIPAESCNLQINTRIREDPRSRDRDAGLQTSNFAVKKTRTKNTVNVDRTVFIFKSRLSHLLCECAFFSICKVTGISILFRNI